jgi:septal ring factor EnvC (AmiA/AmiB activator)
VHSSQKQVAELEGEIEALEEELERLSAAAADAQDARAALEAVTAEAAALRGQVGSAHSFNKKPYYSSTGRWPALVSVPEGHISSPGGAADA